MSESSLPDSLLLQLDRSAPVPMWFQISRLMAEAIGDGTIATGSRIDNEVALAARLGVSRPTVRQAIQELVARGLLVRRRGVGTQVVHGKVMRKVELTSLYDDLLRAGRTPTTTLLHAEHEPASDEVATALGIAPQAHVLHLRRLRLAEGVPLAVMENFVPEHVELDVTNLTQHGLYRLLRASGVTIAVAKQQIGARAARAQESRALEIEPASPVLTLQRTAFDDSGLAVEFGCHSYRPDIYSFELTLVDR